jgi:hypothetical protein
VIWIAKGKKYGRKTGISSCFLPFQDFFDEGWYRLNSFLKFYTSDCNIFRCELVSMIIYSSGDNIFNREVKMKVSKIIPALFVLLVLPGASMALDILWTFEYDLTFDDECYAILQVSDGGFVACGSVVADALFLKLNAQGELLWDRSFGEYGFGESINSIEETTDGGFILAGSRSASNPNICDIYLVKTDSEGNILWEQRFGKDDDEWASAVHQTLDGGYVLAGTTESFGTSDKDIFLLKTGPLGNLEWYRIYGDMYWDYCHDMQITSDGGYILAGSTCIDWLQDDYDIYLVKTDEHGNVEWQCNLGGSNDESCASVRQTVDGGYILGGKTQSYGLPAGSSNGYIVKTDSSGGFEWDYWFGSDAQDYCTTIIPVENGYTFSGYAQTYQPPDQDSHIILGKIDETGSLIWTQIYRFADNQSERSRDLDVTLDGGYILGGISNRLNSCNDNIFIIRTESDLTEIEDPRLTLSLSKTLTPSVYPNPFNPITEISYCLDIDSHVSLSVYDLGGRLIARLIDGWESAGNHRAILDAADLPSGMYIYRLTTDEFTFPGKMMLIK